jgi:hypothetical protein
VCVVTLLFCTSAGANVIQSRLRLGTRVVLSCEQLWSLRVASEELLLAEVSGVMVQSTMGRVPR